MNTYSKNKTFLTTISALFVALTAVCSWISVPVPGTSVPINLATFAVLLSGVILGSRRGAFAMIVFLLLGAVGVPVFHSFTGGFGILMGPTGGFLIGYIAMAFIAGFHRDKKLNFIIACLLAEVVLYAFGVLWFMITSGNNLTVAITACVLPFIPGDIVKIILVRLVKSRIEKYV